MADTSSMPTLRHRMQAAAAKIVWGFLRLLPVDAASSAGSAFFRFLGPRLRAHRVAERNLRNAFPEKSDAEIAAILRGMWDNLGRTAAELPHMDHILDLKAGRIELVGEEHLDQLRADGKPGLLISAHIGNWELGPLLAGREKLPLHLFYRAPNNPLVADMYTRLRTGSLGELLPKGRQGARRAVQLLAEGGHLGMLIDQKMNDGIAVPFFGRDAMTAPALAQLALKFDAPVVPARVIRVGGARFRVVVEEPLALPRSEDRHGSLIEIMRIVNARVESWIREHPEQWLWVHRRWPD